MQQFTVGTDKVLAKLDTPNLEGWITVSSIKELCTYAKKPVNRERFPTPVWKGSKFPAALMQQVLGTIHEFPRMETAYSLYYNIRTKEWAVKCPDQNGAGASVSYEDDGSGMPDGFSIIGSIHTHPEMSAFWSGTDLNDQTKKHGIHFVFGLRDGLVRYSLCTVFTPTEQFDQDIHNVVEDFDWSQVYPAVPEWVETIKKQAYRRAAATPAKTTTWPAYTRYATSKLPVTHYGHAHREHYDYLDLWEDYYGSTSFIDDYRYVPRDYKSNGYTYSYADEGASDEQVEKYISLIDDIARNTNKGEAFRLALLDPQVRGEIEQQLDLVIVDTSDKGEIISGFSELVAVIPQADKMTNEEERQIVYIVLDGLPNVNLIDPAEPAFRNAPMIDSINNLMDGLVDSYCENPECISSTDMGTLLNNLKTWYDTLLMTAAQHDTDTTTDTEATEC